MHNTADTKQLFQELDYRESTGIEVSLLWYPNTKRVAIYVCDTRTNEAFEVPIAAHQARDAFNHPYAYSAEQGTETVAATSLAA